MGELEKLRSLLYDAIVELSFVQSVENCNSGLCATTAGRDIINRGIEFLGVADLSAEKWENVGKRTV